MSKTDAAHNRNKLTAKRKALVDALVETKPGDTITDIANRAGMSRQAYYKNIDLDVIVNEVKKGKRRRMKTGDLTGEAVNEAAVFLREALDRITSKARAGEDVSDNDIARVMQLNKHLFDIQVKTAELGLDADRSLSSTDTEQEAAEEIETAIRVGLLISGLPAVEWREQIGKVLDVWRKHGSIQSLAPDLPPLPDDSTEHEVIDLGMEPVTRLLPPVAAPGSDALPPTPPVEESLELPTVSNCDTVELETVTGCQLVGPFGPLDPADQI